MDKRFYLLFHNYYGRHEWWMHLFVRNLPRHAVIYYNVVEESIYNAGLQGGELLHQLNVIAENGGIRLQLRFSNNQGKDVGGKLLLVDAMQRNSDTEPGFIMLLHDKHSPHKSDPEAWKRKLFRLTEKSVIEQAIMLLNSKPDVGLVCAEGTVQDTLENERNDSGMLAQMGRQYDLAGNRYVAGNMFITRSEQLFCFFSDHPPLAIRGTLDKGNVMDDFRQTVTHCWERLFSWLAVDSRKTFAEV